MTTERTDLGQMRLGLITLMAQALPQSPLDGLRGRGTREAQFEVADDIVAIANTIATTEVETLQLARTMWFLGELAFEEYRPDFSSQFFTRAAEVYIRRRLWPQIATLYSNLGLSEAGAGHTSQAVNWLSLSTHVSGSLGNNSAADVTRTVADAIRKEPNRFFAPTMQLQEILASRAVQAPGAVMAEVYGLGLVAISAVTPDVLTAIATAIRTGEVLLPLVQSDWPEGLITATAVDLQIISRILKNPELLDNLEPRAFEVLISNLFQGFGAEVELTKQTRDSGFDVGAVFEIGDARFRVLIEAKKWRESRKVGIGTVDRLLGVKQRLKADRVVLATTSSFSSVAQTAAAQLHTEIELVDRSGVVKWVERYMLPIAGTPIKLPSINVAPKSAL